MKPTIPRYKRDEQRRIERARRAWLAKGNTIDKLPPAGENTQPKVSIKDKAY